MRSWLLVTGNGGETQRVRHVKCSGFPINLINGMAQGNEVAARGFRSTAGRIFPQFQLVGPQQEPTLLLETFNRLRFKLRFTLHILVYAIIALRAPEGGSATRQPNRSSVERSPRAFCNNGCHKEGVVPPDVIRAYP